MGTLFAIAVMATVSSGIVFMAWRELQNRRRCRTWVRTEAIVCADQNDLGLGPSRQPRRSTTVMFEGPDGLHVAPLLYSASTHPGFAVGTRIPVVYDPANPTRVEQSRGGDEHLWSLLVYAGMLALLALGVGAYVLRG